MAALSLSFISETNPCDLYPALLSERKAYYDEICRSKTDTDSTISFHSFCRLFYNIESNTAINDYTTSILDRYTKPYHLKNKPYQISIAHKTPLAQFIVDVYFQSVLKHNWNINQFMEKSAFLSSVPRQSRTWNTIRQHLSRYLNNIHYPIHPQLILKDAANQMQEESVTKHDMTRVLYYVKHIHRNLFTLTHLCQVDLVFVTQKIAAINDEYFDNLGVAYQKLHSSQSNNYYNIRSTTFWSMMRRFNDCMHKNCVFIDETTADKRCVILIMGNSRNVHQDIVYIFEPVEDNTLPVDIINHTELPFIINSKNDHVLPILSCAEYDALSLSIHTHKITDAERVYFQYKSYGTRVFKYNLKEVLQPFCQEIDEKIVAQLRWDKEIKEREFPDCEYFAFTTSYFNDLHSITPQLAHYFQANNVNNRWSANLYRNMVRDTAEKYVYSAPAYSYFLHINDLINTYYQTMGCNVNEKQDTFINYIHDNEFGDCDLNEMLTTNAADECAISWFDDTFPVDLNIFNVKNDADRDRFIFYFIQHCYFFGTLPAQNYMLDKFMKMKP